MARDITMIIAVFASLISLVFGVYQALEARNARAFAYEQAYRIMGVVQRADLSSLAKKDITEKTLNAFSAPASILDLSRSSADSGANEVCAISQKQVCSTLARQLAEANAQCLKAKLASCSPAESLKSKIIEKSCYDCF